MIARYPSFDGMKIRMGVSSVTGLTMLLVVLGVGSVPAAAQTMLPVEMILPPEHAAAPATSASTALGFNLSPAPVPSGLFHASKPVPHPAQVNAATTDPRPAPARTDLKPEPGSVPMPPPKPSGPARAPKAAAPPPAPAEPLELKPNPVVTASAGPAAVAKVEQLSNKAIVERANAYFTNLTTLVADFTQVGGDGRRVGGTLYLQRPGKVRFEYDPPATLEVVADGSSVAVRDTKLATQDLYSISQTPLKFLLREQVNLGQDIAVTDIDGDSDSVRLALEDRSTLGGTSQIMLYFDPQVQNLTQWRIVDAQGFQTIVVLNKVQKGRTIDQDIFKISYEQILGGSNR